MRVVRIFLLFPLNLYNYQTKRNETRWLEFADIVQVYNCINYLHDIWDYSNLRWFDYETVLMSSVEICKKRLDMDKPKSYRTIL